MATTRLEQYETFAAALDAKVAALQQKIKADDIAQLKTFVIARLEYLRDACQQSSELEHRAYAVNVENALGHLKGEISAEDKREWL